jgi:hypothetical protein
MNNAEIRAKILRLHYDCEMNRTGTFFNDNELPQLISGVAQNHIDANLVYLYRSRLIEGIWGAGNNSPSLTRITPAGIDVVENPERYSGEFSMDVQVLNVGTNYGQVAQAGGGATVTQTQTYSSFNDLRQLVRSHTELTDGDRQRIDAVLGNLEKTVAEKGVTKTVVEQAKQALADYGWLIQPLIAVLMNALGLG